MLEFTWKVFSQTGDINTYLLMKEIERDYQETTDDSSGELAEIDTPLS